MIEIYNKCIGNIHLCIFDALVVTSPDITLIYPTISIEQIEIQPLYGPSKIWMVKNQPLILGFL